MTNRTERRARSLEISAAFGLGFEAVVLAVVAVAYAIYAVLGDTADAGMIVGVAAFCALLAIGVGAGAWGMWHSRRWSRSIALTWQVFQAGLGLAILATQPLVGAVLIVVALAVAAAVFARAGRDDAPATEE